MINGPYVENQYDVGIVLAGGLRKEDDRYLPTTYNDADQFGMLGGEMRVNAAAELYLRRIVGSILMVGGVSEKQREKFGPDVPQEGDVYAQAIVDLVAARRREEPARFGTHDPNEQIVEVVGKACNTTSELIAGIGALGNRSVRAVVISNEYHVAIRVPHLVGHLRKQGDIPSEPTIGFLSAEGVAWKLEPDRYGKEIAEGCRNDNGAVRMLNEFTGLRALIRGEYVFEEFQNSGQVG